jgi:hypothetical protein
MLGGVVSFPSGRTEPGGMRPSMPVNDSANGNQHLAILKRRIRTIYARADNLHLDDPDSTEEPDEDERGVSVHSLPLPSETLIEDISRAVGIHPSSVYRLVSEMRTLDGLACPPELKRHFEDYVSVTVLRLLGFRWPEQDEYEGRNGAVIASDLIEQEGIIPLVSCGEQRTAAQRIRTRLERQFGENGADQSEQGFREWVGRPIEDWLRRDFFRRHLQQFKQRPIAWHFVSPEGTFQAFVLYQTLSRPTLQKLRAQYAGSLIAQMRGEQERARQRGSADEVSQIQLQIEDVEEFRDRLERIERGDELKYRIRCRWKGEEENGRPGPYTPDIDDGVKVNIRPFQEAGLLAVKEVIKKW